MRKPRTLLFAILALLVGFASAWAKYPKSHIVGSAHDLTGAWVTVTTPESSVCYFCHIMHKTGAAPVSTAPGYLLWNHELSAKASYGVYSSDSFNNLLSSSVTITDLGGATPTGTLATSNLCLSCHDGSVAFAYFYASPSFLNLPPLNGHKGTSGTSTTYMYSGFELNDLTRSHPINFTYNSALLTAYGGTGLATPAGAGSVDTAGEIPLYSGVMQCTTCHDVHDGTNKTPFPFPRNFSGTTPFCSSCHT